MRIPFFIFTLLGSFAAIGQPPRDTTRRAVEGELLEAPPEVETGADKVYTVAEVEHSAEFPGGQEQLMRYLGKNIHYPAEAREAEVEGRIFVRFVVDEEGRIGAAKVIRGMPGSGFDGEALRVIHSMPNWIPATHDGKHVKMEYTLPIIFKLAEPAPVSK